MLQCKNREFYGQTQIQHRMRFSVHTAVITRRLRAMGIRDKPSAPASPWQNGFAERMIGSIRRECLDHIVVLGDAHLRQILRSYARYYNDIRTHRSLDKDGPVSRRVSGPESLAHTRSLAGSITTMSGFRFSVHTTVVSTRRFCFDPRLGQSLRTSDAASQR
jgi:hypothetical protein